MRVLLVGTGLGVERFSCLLEQLLEVDGYTMQRGPESQRTILTRTLARNIRRTYQRLQQADRNRGFSGARSIGCPASHLTVRVSGEF